jgi:hypothetical protein
VWNISAVSRMGHPVIQEPRISKCQSDSMSIHLRNFIFSQLFICSLLDSPPMLDKQAPRSRETLFNVEAHRMGIHPDLPLSAVG